MAADPDVTLFRKVFDPEQRDGAPAHRVGEHEVRPNPTPVPRRTHDVVIRLLQDDEQLDWLLGFLELTNVVHVVRVICAAHLVCSKLGDAPAMLARIKERAEACGTNAALMGQFELEWGRKFGGSDDA